MEDLIQGLDTHRRLQNRVSDAQRIVLDVWRSADIQHSLQAHESSEEVSQSDCISAAMHI